MSAPRMISQCLIILGLCSTAALVTHAEETYVPETDPLVLQKLDQWQDLKFGRLQPMGDSRVLEHMFRGRAMVPPAQS